MDGPLTIPPGEDIEPQQKISLEQMGNGISFYGGGSRVAQHQAPSGGGAFIFLSPFGEEHPS